MANNTAFRIIWGVILACHGATSSFVQLATLRTLLGIMESAVSPGFSLVTGIWYRRSEHPMRHGIWFVGNATSGLFGGLIAYGMEHIHSKYSPWRYLFILFGCITILWGIVLLLFLPDSPLKARWLSPSERILANNRPQTTTKSFKTDVWKWDQAFEAVRDPKTWSLFFYIAFTAIPSAGSTNVRFIFGFDINVIDLPIDPVLSSPPSSSQVSPPALSELFSSACPQVESQFFSSSLPHSVPHISRSHAVLSWQSPPPSLW